MEFARQNIQVNLVVPSIVETDLTKHVPKVVVNNLKAETPQNRLPEPVDVAKAIVFFASTQASFATSQRLMVTGGGPPLF